MGMSFAGGGGRAGRGVALEKEGVLRKPKKGTSSSQDDVLRSHESKPRGASNSWWILMPASSSPHQWNSNNKMGSQVWIMSVR